MGIPGVVLNSPADLEALTARVITLSATYTDPANQLVASSFTIEIDTSPGFSSGDLITATMVNVAHNTTQRAAAALSAGTWYYRASATNADGTTTAAAYSFTVTHPNIIRALYQYENVAKYGPDWTQKRTLYQYENVSKYGPDWAKKRGLYQYENVTDEPPFPHIERLSTTRTSQGSVVTIYGNGFGAKAASDPLNADRAARGYGGAAYLGDKQCGIVSWAWQEITFTVPVDAVSGAVFVRLTTPEPPGQRDSNLKGLEIYEAPPTTDTGLELFVCDKNHPNTILAQLDAATEKSFYCQRNASGSGMFRISRLDVKGSDRALVTDQNYILCRLNGVDVFKWIIESRKPAYVDDSEEQWIDVSGRGNMAVLDQAIIYPEGMPYPASLERVWADTHGAAIFLQLFNEAKARGCFPYVTVDFTADHDSLGMPWTDYTDISFHAGTKLGNVAEKLTTGFGLFDLYMTPTFVLRAYKGAENYPGRGTNLAETVRFFKGQSILSHENQSDSTNIENVVLVEGDAGSLVEVTHNLTPSVDAYGRREGYLQARNVPDDWTQLANYGKIKADKSGQVAWGIKLATDFSYHKPFDTYNLGDWIWVHIEPEGSDTIGFDGEVRVVGITVTEDADLKLSAQLELNNIMLERELIMAQLLERLSMGSTDPQMTNPSEEPPAGIAHNHFHGLLLGLEDDTHLQYYNALRHAADPHTALARVTSIKKQGSDAMTGDVTLIPGSNVTLTQNTEQKTITIAASGGGGGGSLQWFKYYLQDPGVSTSAYLTKGSVFQPEEDYLLYGFGAAYNEAVTQTVKIRLYELNGTTQVGAALAESDGLAGAGYFMHRTYKLATPILLEAGKRYIIAMSNVTSGATVMRAALDKHISDSVTGIMGINAPVQNAYIKSANPGNGDTWTLTTSGGAPYGVSVLKPGC